MTQWHTNRAMIAMWMAIAAAVVAACGNGSSASNGNDVDAGPPCVDPAKGLPEDVFCTGLYAGRDSSQYTETAQPYKPGVVLWSDGAEKQRYLYIPPNKKIDTSDLDHWTFPVGTKAWKEFRFDGKLVETRMFWKRNEKTWESGTYIWDKTESNAVLNKALKGTILDTGYEIPSARDCGKCHHGGADNLLGVEALAMALPTAEGVTLATLVKAQALSHPPVNTSVKLPEDDTGKAAVALGYLHANCGMPCHSTRGLGDETKLVLRLRADEFWSNGKSAPVPVAMTDIYKAALNTPPTTAAVAQKFPGAFRITPGDHDKSLLYLLSHLRGNYQMPPLVSHKVDAVGTKNLAAWIDALPH